MYTRRLHWLMPLVGCLGVACTGDTAAGDDQGGDTQIPCPVLELGGDEVAFGTVTSGETHSTSLDLRNACTTGVALEVEAEITADPDGIFTATISQSALEAGDTEPVVVTLSDGTAGEHSGTLTLFTNDPDTPIVSLAISALVSDDVDGDGFEAGEDCDDAASDVYPGAPETLDGVDEDCDGTVDEDFISEGEVVITEIMADPLGVDDALGEWFEVTNTADHAIDLMGWLAAVDGLDDHVIAESLVVPVGGAVVIGRSADTNVNGLVPVDYAVGDDLKLGDSIGTLRLSVDDRDIAWSSWDSDGPGGDGTAAALDPDYTTQVYAVVDELWCAATVSFGVGDRGTPGEANTKCTTIDEDNDGYSVDEGDCDDLDASVAPGLVDIWNGVDDDCDGNTDVERVTALDQGYLYGDTWDALGQTGRAFGDVDGDGAADALMGAWTEDDGGALLVVPLADIEGATAVTDVATAVISLPVYGEDPPVLGAAAMDADGDGVLDVAAVNATTGLGVGRAGVWLFTGGSTLSGSLTTDDATASVTFSDPTQVDEDLLSAPEVADLDGDGLDDLFLSQASSAPTETDGSVWVFTGDQLNGELFTDDADFELTHPPDQPYLGRHLRVGDLTGDGTPDLVLSGEELLGGTLDEGGVWVLDGAEVAAGTRLLDSITVDIRHDDPWRNLTEDGAFEIVDIDADGQLDLVIGGQASGSLWFFEQAILDGTLGTADATWETTSATEDIGHAVFTADWNGDGVEDLWIGAISSTSRGTFGVLDGAAAGSWTFDYDADVSYTVEGSTTGDGFGNVSWTGDADGDGDTDLVIGGVDADAASIYLWLAE